MISVNRTLVYYKSYDKSSPNYGRAAFEFHDPKTEKGKRKIPMTLKAEIVAKGYKAPEGYEELVFVTSMKILNT